MIALRPFGTTGHQSTRVIFGAAALGGMRQERADRVLEVVRSAGINHLDTAASYGDSELRLAPLLTHHRDEFFVATKTGQRTGDGARAELERSLNRLGVDHVDLIQLHNLVEHDEFDVAHGPGGAVEALAKARDEGLVHHIGVTGHGLRIAERHLMSLERFDFASVLLPYSHVLLRDPAYRSSVERLLEVCAQRGVAVQTIKAVARRRWPPEASGPRFSWYEPLPAGAALARAVAYVLSHPQLFLNTSSDATLLDATIAAAQGDPVAPTEEDLESDEDALGVTPLFDGEALERI
jgi:aryl-alcohol dehydrogenase-like predicted oxidoreductase